MKYAIVTNGVVTNVAASNRPLSADWIEVPVGSGVSIGDHWDGKMFHSPSGTPRFTAEMQSAQEYIKNLELQNNQKDEVIKALTDRVNLAEDCIAEMASVLYA